MLLFDLVFPLPESPTKFYLRFTRDPVILVGIDVTHRSRLTLNRRARRPGLCAVTREFAPPNLKEQARGELQPFLGSLRVWLI